MKTMCDHLHICPDIDQNRSFEIFKKLFLKNNVLYTHEEYASSCVYLYLAQENIFRFLPEITTRFNVDPGRILKLIKLEDIIILHFNGYISFVDNMCDLEIPWNILRRKEVFANYMLQNSSLSAKTILVSVLSDSKHVKKLQGIFAVTNGQIENCLACAKHLVYHNYKIKQHRQSI